MKVDVKGWDISVQSDLYEAGITEDGSRFTAETYFIQARREDGLVMTHFLNFDGAEKVQTEDGFDFFGDVRKEAYRQAKILRDRIIRNGIIDDTHWSKSASYGSEYYCRVNNI